jgi:GT2 family glycosyltransferase
VIIPVWNRCELTRDCITALAKTTEGLSWELIVVDNHSTDGTQAFLSSLGGDVQIILNQENFGFAKACNQGAQAARGKYLVFLNNDTVPQDGWLRALVAEVDGHPEVGIVGSKLLYGDGTVQHAGVVFLRSKLSPYHIYRKAPADLSAVNVRREFQVVTGACMLVRSQLFNKLGGFDERFRNGFEDVDLCLKAREKGYRVVYQPRSVLYHLESQTPGRKLHEVDNSRLLQERWGSHWWLADEDLHYHADGYKVIGSEATGEYVGHVRLIEDIKDRVAWAHVAATQSAAQKKDWNGVKRELSLVQDWPNDPYVLSWAAMVCEQLNEPTLRHTFLIRYLELNDSPAVRRSLVRSLLTHKCLAAAEQQLNTLLAGAPDDAEGLLLLGLLYMQREQYREAETALSSALRQGADRKKCLMGMGMASMGRAYAQGAWERFLEVLADNPDDADAIHWLLRAGTAQNRWDGLSQHLRAYVSRNPRDLATRFALAGVLLRADQIEAARREHDILRAAAPLYDGLAALEEAIARQEAVLAMESMHT